MTAKSAERMQDLACLLAVGENASSSTVDTLEKGHDLLQYFTIAKQ